MLKFLSLFNLFNFKLFSRLYIVIYYIVYFSAKVYVNIFFFRLLKQIDFVILVQILKIMHLKLHHLCELFLMLNMLTIYFFFLQLDSLILRVTCIDV